MNAVHTFCPVPVAGDWNGSGTTKVGVYYVDGNNQSWWLLDTNGDGLPNDGNAIPYGWGGSTPVVGDWNGDGRSEIGVWAANSAGQGFWYLDTNHDYAPDTTIAYGWR